MNIRFGIVTPTLTPTRNSCRGHTAPGRRTGLRDAGRDILRIHQHQRCGPRRRRGNQLQAEDSGSKLAGAAAGVGSLPPDVAQRGGHRRAYDGRLRFDGRSDHPAESDRTKIRRRRIGSLLNIHLYKKWLWSSEYAFSRDNANASDPTSKREFGRAWRTGISGNPGKTNVNVAYRDVSANFGNPANPSLTQAASLICAVSTLCIAGD